MKTVVYIVRHGERVDSKNPGWRLQAKFPHDPGLSVRGQQQAARLALHLQNKGIRHICSSPYLRARQTAAPVAEVLNLPVRIEEGICEWLNPEWSDRRPKLCEAVPLDHSLVRAVFPESDEQAWKRSGEAARLLVAGARGPLLLVTHGHAMCGAIYGLLGHREVELHCDYCALAEIHIGPEGAVLIRNGDTSFLDGDGCVISDRACPPDRGKA